MMKFRIKETGEVKELVTIGNNGIEWTRDLLGNHDALNYNDNTEEYELTNDDYEWWNEWIEKDDSINEEKQELIEQLNVAGVSEKTDNRYNGWDIVEEAVAEATIGTELDNVHDYIKEALQEIRNEWGIVL